MVVGELDIGPRPASFYPEEEKVGVTVKYKRVVLKIPTTLLCSMLEKQLMEFVVVDLGLRPALLPPLI